MAAPWWQVEAAVGRSKADCGDYTPRRQGGPESQVCLYIGIGIIMVRGSDG